MVGLGFARGFARSMLPTGVWYNNDRPGFLMSHGDFCDWAFMSWLVVFVGRP